MEESEEEAQKRQEILRIYNSTKDALKIIDEVAREKIDLSASNQLIKLQPETLQTFVSQRRPPPQIANNQPQQQLPNRNFTNGILQPVRTVPAQQPINRVFPPNNSVPARVLPGTQPPEIPKRPSTGSLFNGNGSFKFNN